MSYTIVMTETEESELRAMADKGYDCGLWEHLHVVHVRDSWARYQISEHKMWECAEQYNYMLEGGNDPWGPFVAETLRPKLDALMAEVV